MRSTLRNVAITAALAGLLHCGPLVSASGFWALIFGGSQTTTKQASTSNQTKPNDDHNCGCFPNKTEKRLKWCDKNGNPDLENGEYLCCADCGMVCGRPGPKRELPPVTPFPPPCPTVPDHIANCGTSATCPKCGHPCIERPPAPYASCPPADHCTTTSAGNVCVHCGKECG